MSKNVIDKAKGVCGKINNRYALKAGEIKDIYDGSNGSWGSMITMSFNYGYLQGMRAARAEMEKAGK